ncbi:N-acetyl-gamma-glutamyl-phosphate reductase [Roseospira marina]|uniref:N-acetyl-gamma-glutamyl-phosphate reductase n=1 Tax=Roseospira marina TaxID=140057 RepID=A0A5M6IHB6_9PROT|nr:N-acetyl-gamma-glutamyl-phosphate reductase [Roseospira marina]KAA5607624.1 N-acetyl-gamma-glutamyl-phosphate reductase [Roseospira marina]MBB4312176.1 N-acetyl-gamma-glutamyl-phosphate reductase [Roseospira marina]MBB5085808.1 N-acetyl-gamma-glutamyl-phosphate reductase [Roseospira marina]
MSDPIRIAILGASGYTGAELIRLLGTHSRAQLAILTADRRAGQTLGAVFPHLAHVPAPPLVAIDDVTDWSGVDVVFCCLPHATTQSVIAALPDHLKIVDLSADFRLADVDVYAQWYGGPHKAPELQKSAVYGLTELARPEVAAARLVANPGCYPTGPHLALVPLIESGLIDPDGIIIDAKSGVSGAGRSAKEGLLHGEVSEGIHAYGVASHRHSPEIEQALSRAAGRSVMASFTPHLMPMNRGILCTMYVQAHENADAATLLAKLAVRYKGEPFVKILPEGTTPHTRHVRGSNLCLIGAVNDRVPGRVILVSAIDNLVKGAAGQAVQNMNVMMGLPETDGLSQYPMFP